MFLICTDLRIGVSGSKFNAEADFEVRFAVALQKSGQNGEKLIFRPKFSPKKNFQRRKMKRRESSETRFPEVWRLYGPCLRGKQPFKVYQLDVVPRRNQIELTDTKYRQSHGRTYVLTYVRTYVRT